MPNAYRLDTLRLLREKAGVSQEMAATYCGLAGRQGRLSLGAWERGESIPHAKRRARFIPYLWDHLKLRHDPAQFQQVWEMLVEEWEWDPISDGEWQRLTSAPRPASRDATTPSSQPSPPVPFQAPALTPHFVGRQAEFGQLETMLTDPTAPRIVALVGMGGIGKTTLALCLAHQLRRFFKDGVLWANAAYSKPMEILQSWALAYGCDFYSLKDVESRAAAVRNLLSDKAVLLVVDDLRSLEQTKPLLPASSTCVVLLTTRDHESAASLNAQIVPVQVLEQQDGIALLRQILGKDRVNREEQAAHAICTVVQNLPLAIEISARILAKMPWQPLHELAQRLHNTKDRLEHLQLKTIGNEQDLKNLSVRATFEVSWQLLTDKLRKLFPLLALFEGRTFTLAALACVAGQPEAETGEQAAELVSLSLLTLAADPQTGEFRFHQHPLLADFARERLEDNAIAQTNFVAYYLAFCAQHQQILQKFAPEWGNVMSAMQICHEQQRDHEVLEFAELLYPVWERVIRYDEATVGLSWACTAARRIQSDMQLARHLHQWGTILTEQNKYEQAGNLLDKSLKIVIGAEDDALVAQLYWTLARVAIEQADYGKAEPLLLSCKETRNYLNDGVGIAAVLYWQAMIAFRQARYNQALELCQEALLQQDALEDSCDALRTTRLLLDIALECGDQEAAAKVAQQLQTLVKKTQDQGESAAASFNLGKFYRRIGEQDKAQAHFLDCLPTFQKMGSLNFCAFTQYELSRSYAALQEWERALPLCQQCITLLQQTGDRYNVIFAQAFEGDLYLQLKNLSQAQISWKAALSIAHPQQHPYVEALEKRLRENPY